FMKNAYETDKEKEDENILKLLYNDKCILYFEGNTDKNEEVKKKKMDKKLE
ncbi:hypothetical protein COBT_002109, partial [Conglomerata obtusa]